MMGSRRGGALRELMKRKDYGRLRQLLAGWDRRTLARQWPAFRPLEKLVFFKLLDAPAAMDFYGRLPFQEQYFLLCGFPVQSIAPVLEEVGVLERRLFVQLPRDFHARMFRRLLKVPLA